MLQISNLCKYYGSFKAVDNISFSLENNGVYGFLGPNGAGKSTTMNMISGCLSATEGKILIDGIDIQSKPVEAKRLIGFLPEIPPLYPDMSVYEFLCFVCESKKADKSSLKGIMEKTSIEGVATKLIKQLSKGYKQRVGIAMALIGDPRLIILDEPTAGLDPSQIIEIRNLIVKLGREHIVFLSSHILSEISAVSSQLIIIAKGKLIAQGTIEELETRYASDFFVTLSAKGNSDECEATVRSVCEDYTKLDGGEYIIRSSDECICENLFFAFAERGLPIIRLEPHRTTLEEMFIKLTQGESLE